MLRQFTRQINLNEREEDFYVRRITFFKTRFKKTNLSIKPVSTNTEIEVSKIAMVLSPLSITTELVNRNELSECKKPSTTNSNTESNIEYSERMKVKHHKKGMSVSSRSNRKKR